MVEEPRPRIDAWPLVGRDTELARLTGAFGMVTSVVITGAAGIGKTRLADELLCWAAERGRHVLRLVATPWLGTVPFQVFAEVLQGTDADPRDGVRFLEAARRAVCERAEGRPVVLGVDDVHLLDLPSAALVHHLAATLEVTAVATLRSGAAAPAPIASLWRGRPSERVALGPLRREEVDRLLGRVLGGPVERDAGERLWQLSLGNPMALHELVLSGIETGSLRQVAGSWRLDRDRRLAASPRLREILPARFGRLAPATRRVAELLAVGEPLGVALLESLADPAALEAAEQAGLVVERPEADGQRVTATLAHPLYGEVLRASLVPARRRAIQRALADRLEQTGARRRDDLLRLVVWRHEAGVALAPELLLRAAQRASASADFAMAGRLALKAVALGGGLRARLVAASALHAVGRPLDADALLADLDPGEATEGERVELAVNRATILLYGCGRSAAAASVLESAQAEVGNPDWQTAPWPGPARCTAGRWHAATPPCSRGLPARSRRSTRSCSPPKDGPRQPRRTAAPGGPAALPAQPPTPSGSTTPASARRPGAAPPRRPCSPDHPRAGGRRPGPVRPQQPPDRRAAGGLGADRREPPLERLPEARHPQCPRAPRDLR